MNADELLKHSAFLRGLATSLLRGEQDVDDVVQQAYLKALEHRPRRPRAWMGKVVRNLAFRSRRSRARVARRERSAARPEAVASSSDDVERLEIQRKLVDAVLQLDEPYRTVIVRRYFDELAPREIARRTGVPYETVRTRLGRALRALRRRLDAEHASWALVLAPLLLRPPRPGLLGGVMMSAKKTTLLVSLPLAGIVVGVAGHAVLTGSGETSPARAPGSGRGGPLAAQIAELRTEVASLRREIEGMRSGAEDGRDAADATAGTVGAPAARRAEQALERLLSITQGERQLAIRQAFVELSQCGDAVVPAVVAALKAGRDRDYGGGFSFGGNMMRGYPRLRTVLIDVLRQIGTPAAQEGLLDALRGSKDLLDYRDLFLLYGSTTDEMMVRGMSEMVPGLLQEMKRKGEEAAGLLLSDSVTRWIRNHGLRDTTDLLEELARESFIAGKMDRGAFKVLVEFSPEQAFGLARQLHEKGAGRGFSGIATSLRMGRTDVALAQITRFCELVFSQLDLDAGTRRSFYMSLPSRLCKSIASSEARAADGKVLLAFLSKRLREETGSFEKRVLTDKIARLEQEIGKCESR
ncbi:MAG: RNA polymerase sigma factor [Planctomycetota bacterium]